MSAQPTPASPQAQAKQAPPTKPAKQPKKSVEKSSKDPEPDILALGTALADRLSSLAADTNAFLKRAAQDLDIDDVPVHFRRHGPHDVGVVYSLQFYIGGERVRDMSGDFPFPNMLYPTQLGEAFARIGHILKFTIMEPFLTDISSSVAARIAAASTKALPAPKQEALPEEAAPAPPQSGSMADLHG